MKLILGFIGLLYGVNVVIGYQNEGLKVHNNYRKAHKVPLLQLDKKMNKQAQACAQRLAGIKGLKHTDKKTLKSLNQGENFGMATTTGSDVEDVQNAIQRWYNEIKLYDFKRPNGMTGKDGKFGSVGHFTQVVWKDTKQLGIGVARAGGKAYVCARYSPPGNFNKANKKNVFPKG